MMSHRAELASGSQIPRPTHFSALGCLLVGCFVCGCLDDDVDSNSSFLRAGDGVSEQDDDPPVVAVDGGSELFLGEAVKLGNLTSYIAVDRDFSTFEDWSYFDLGVGKHVVSQSGRKRVYVNALPQPGDTEFRVGTILVKVLELGDDPVNWQVHGMVKRGGEYNSKGAYGWEYFDFTINAEGTPRQNWRGEQTPDGESYQVTVFTPNGVVIEDVADCNTCHQSGNNDAVNTPALNLDLWR
jgi:hypothetical protein